jgi:hypothetical protein
MANRPTTGTAHGRRKGGATIAAARRSLHPRAPLFATRSPVPDKNTRPSVRGLVDLIRGSDGLPLVAWEPQEGEEFFARLFQAVGDRAAAQPPLRRNALRLASTSLAVSSQIMSA